MNNDLQSLLDQRLKLLDQMDELVDSGGRLLRNDPLMVRYHDVNQKITALRKKN